MMGTPTTFVVGAGASAAYGMPLGRDLRRKAEQLEPRSEIYRLLNQTQFDVGRLNNWLEDLRYHPTKTIDVFLESRLDEPDFVSIGKAVIASLMGVAIQDAKGPPRHDDIDWLGEIFEWMRDGARTFDEFLKGNRNVRFVTFNFDSVIEERLVRDVAALYTISEAQAGDGLAKTIPVIHVHGRLPFPPKDPLGASVFDAISPTWIGWLKDAAKTVNVITDSIDPISLSAARRAVKESTVLCFLGFAYARENLARLDIPNGLKKDTYQHVFGSAFKIEAGERHLIEQRFKEQIRLGGTEHHCAAFLRSFPIFRD